jgi:hypothetical protein
MATTRFGQSSTWIQHLLDLFSHFFALYCFSLPIFVLASKIHPLLITTACSIDGRVLSLHAAETNRIQREFSSNVAIASQERLAVTSRRRSRSKFSPKIAIFSNPTQTFFAPLSFTELSSGAGG